MSVYSYGRAGAIRSFCGVALFAATFAAFGLGSSAALAQESIRCIDDPVLGIPDDCESFVFEIQVTDVADPGGVYGTLLPGTVVSGTFTVDNTVPDVEAGSENGRYLNAVECFTLSLPEREMRVDLEPVEISLPAAESDPGITVMNDVTTAAPPFSLRTDTATFALAGFSRLDVTSTPNPFDVIPGGGGAAFGYGDSCIEGIQTPCPPTVLADDGIPAAAGDTTVLASALFSFDFLSLSGDFGRADAEILAIDSTNIVACPEPGFATALIAGGLLLASRRPRARTSDRLVARWRPSR